MQLSNRQQKKANNKVEVPSPVRHPFVKKNTFTIPNSNKIGGAQNADLRHVNSEHKPLGGLF
jgi:hypothetical protein